MAVRLSPEIEVDAVGFDLDRTLGFDDRLELRLMVAYARAAAERRGITAGQPVIGERAATLLAQARAGTRTVDEAVSALLAAYLPRAEALAAALRWREEVVAQAETQTRPALGAQACIARLEARGVRLAILTNGWSPLQEVKARALGLAHLPILVSERIGAFKPAPEAFTALLARLGTRADRTAYVGDDFAGDVQGARACAMPAVWVTQHEPSEKELRAMAEGVVRIRSLDELAP